MAQGPFCRHCAVQSPACEAQEASITSALMINKRHHYKMGLPGACGLDTEQERRVLLRAMHVARPFLHMLTRVNVIMQ